MNSTTVYYQLMFEPTKTTNAEKLEGLNQLIGDTRDPKEKISYLFNRAKVYHDDKKWNESLSDIRLIGQISRGNTNASLRALRLKNNIQLHLDAMRECIVEEFVNHIDDKDKFENLLKLLDPPTIDNILTEKQTERSIK